MAEYTFHFDGDNTYYTIEIIYYRTWCCCRRSKIAYKKQSCNPETLEFTDVSIGYITERTFESIMLLHNAKDSDRLKNYLEKYLTLDTELSTDPELSLLLSNASS